MPKSRSMTTALEFNSVLSESPRSKGEKKRDLSFVGSAMSRPSVWAEYWETVQLMISRVKAAALSSPFSVDKLFSNSWEVGALDQSFPFSLFPKVSTTHHPNLLRESYSGSNRISLSQLKGRIFATCVMSTIGGKKAETREQLWSLAFDKWKL